jgi:hypothetical protein
LRFTWHQIHSSDNHFEYRTTINAWNSKYMQSSYRIPSKWISSITISATFLTYPRVCQLRDIPSHFSGVVTINDALLIAHMSGVTSPVNSTILQHTPTDDISCVQIHQLTVFRVFLQFDSTSHACVRVLVLLAVQYRHTEVNFSSVIFQCHHHKPCCSVGHETL